MKRLRVLNLFGWASAAWLATAAAVLAIDVRGPAEAIAGDTVRIAGRTILLYGAVAPQPQERCFDAALPWWCGKNSRERLERLIRGGEVHCLDKGRTADGKMLGLCRVGTVDLAESQISNGMAIVDGTRGWTYLEAERSARRAQTGIWHGNPNGSFSQ